jgi:hypothetical protein
MISFRGELANPLHISLLAVGGAALVNPHYAESIVPGAASNGRRYRHSAQVAAMEIREEACHIPTRRCGKGAPRTPAVRVRENG